MSKSTSCLLFLTAAATLSATPAKAQSFVLYPGSTVYGDELRGFGVAAYGLGVYNLNTSMATSIYADAWMRMNEYLYLSNQEYKRQRAYRITAERRGSRQHEEQRRQQLIDQPEPRDIQQGDALNALAGMVLKSQVHMSNQRIARVGVPGGTLQKLPLVHATTQAVISLDRINIDGQWPIMLKDARFEGMRGEYAAALEGVLAELNDRRVSGRTLDALEQVVDRLGNALKAGASQANPIDAREARAFIDHLSASGRVLRDTESAKLLVDVTGYRGTTVADMLAFMRHRDLRFGRAETETEREQYVVLHNLLGEHRENLREALPSK